MTWFALVVTFGISISLCDSQSYVGGGAIDQQLIVSEHNRLRQLVAEGKIPGQPKATNLGPLRWDATLAAEAQKIADTCVYSHVDVPDRRFKVGQNIGMISGYFDGLGWKYMINSWFSEHKNYNYPGSVSSGITGHYTQIVWADTKYIGCGFRQCENSENIYVCNYGPRGNWIGEAPYETSGKKWKQGIILRICFFQTL